MRGHVTPGGPALRFPLAPDLACLKLSVGPLDNNSYLILPSQGPAMLIDAPTDVQRLLEVIGDRDLSVVVTTHCHRDHLGALADVVAVTGATPICGTADRAAIAAASGVDCRPVWTGDNLACQGYDFEVIGLVGHTPGSIALVSPGLPVHIFSGDALFPGGVGKTSSPEAFESLYRDVTGEIFDRFADDTVIHPGHGDDTTLGAERPQLAEWQNRGW